MAQVRGDQLQKAAAATRASHCFCPSPFLTYPSFLTYGVVLFWFCLKLPNPREVNTSRIARRSAGPLRGPVIFPPSVPQRLETGLRKWRPVHVRSMGEARGEARDRPLTPIPGLENLAGPKWSVGACPVQGAGDRGGKGCRREGNLPQPSGDIWAGARGRHEEEKQGLVSATAGPDAGAGSIHRRLGPPVSVN